MKTFCITLFALLSVGFLSAQNVGIGINMPTEKLHVNGNIRLADDADIFGVDIIQGFNDIRFLATPASTTADMFLSGDGNLGIGIGETNPTEKLEVNGNIQLTNGSLKIDQNTGGGMLLLNRDTWAHSNGSQDFGSGGDYIMMASEEGSGESAGMYGDGDHLTFWSPGDGAPGQPSALAYFLDEDSFDGADTDPFNSSALQAYLNTAGVWQVSDERKKANIQPMANAIEKVQSLNGYTYEFLPNEQELAKGDQPMPAAGVMAQELKQVLPEAVNETESGEHFVNYSAIVPLLIEAIKSQQTQIEQLESQIQELMGE